MLGSPWPERARWQACQNEASPNFRNGFRQILNNRNWITHFEPQNVGMSGRSRLLNVNASSISIALAPQIWENFRPQLQLKDM